VSNGARVGMIGTWDCDCQRKDLRRAKQMEVEIVIESPMITLKSVSWGPKNKEQFRSSQEKQVEKLRAHLDAVKKVARQPRPVEVQRKVREVPANLAARPRKRSGDWPCHPPLLLPREGEETGEEREKRSTRARRATATPRPMLCRTGPPKSHGSGTSKNRHATISEPISDPA
jgi:hypothetical protein